MSERYNYQLERDAAREMDRQTQMRLVIELQRTRLSMGDRRLVNLEDFRDPERYALVGPPSVPPPCKNTTSRPDPQDIYDLVLDEQFARAANQQATNDRLDELLALYRAMVPADISAFSNQYEDPAEANEDSTTTGGELSLAEDGLPLEWSAPPIYDNLIGPLEEGPSTLAPELKDEPAPADVVSKNTRKRKYRALK